MGIRNLLGLGHQSPAPTLQLPRLQIDFRGEQYSVVDLNVCVYIGSNKGSLFLNQAKVATIKFDRPSGIGLSFWEEELWRVVADIGTSATLMDGNGVEHPLAGLENTDGRGRTQSNIENLTCGLNIILFGNERISLFVPLWNNEPLHDGDVVDVSSNPHERLRRVSKK